MHRTARLAVVATFAALSLSAAAHAGAPDAYGVVSPAQPDVTTFTAAGPATAPQPYYAPEPVYAPAPKGGYYDEARYGGNDAFGYEPNSACGGLLEGERCLVILNDHMRRVRLEREAGTILVGNPTIADVTVLGADTLFVSARTIGATNIIVLDKQGEEIVTYEVFVREPSTKRITLRQGPDTLHYQCAPYCERALAQTDTASEHRNALAVIGADLALDGRSIQLQSGANPNTDPSALNPQGAGAGASAASGGGAGIASAVGGLPGADGMGAAGMLGGLLGGGAPAAPVMADQAPPLPAQ